MMLLRKVKEKKSYGRTRGKLAGVRGEILLRRVGRERRRPLDLLMGA